VTRRVVYSPRAQHQLTELYVYIAEQSGFPDRAHDFTTAIIEHCDGLADAPMLGRARDDLRPGLRTIGFRRRVVIAFAVYEDAVEIHGVFYGGQDYETDLSDRDA
jgi:toxin ParE1/3/4